MTTDDAKLVKLQTELAQLRTLGVFYLVPTVRTRFDGNGEELLFRKRGRVICDPNQPYKRTIALPRRSPKRTKELLEKLERTKKAAELVKQVNELIKRKQEQAKTRSEAEVLLETAANLRKQAAELERQAKAAFAGRESFTAVH